MNRIKVFLFVFLLIVLGVPVHAGQWISRVFGPLFLQNISKKVLNKKFLLSRGIEGLLLYIPVRDVSQNDDFENVVRYSDYLENDDVHEIIKNELGIAIKNIFVFKNSDVPKDLAFTNNGCIFVSQKLIKDLLKGDKINQNDSLATIAHEYGHTLQKLGASQEDHKRYFSQTHLQTIAAFTVFRSLLLLKKVKQMANTSGYITSFCKAFLWGRLQHETTVVRYLDKRRDDEFEADRVLFIKDPEKRLQILDAMGNFFAGQPVIQRKKSCDFFELIYAFPQLYETHPTNEKRVQNIEHEKTILLNNHPELCITLGKKD